MTRFPEGESLNPRRYPESSAASLCVARCLLALRRQAQGFGLAVAVGVFFEVLGLHGKNFAPCSLGNSTGNSMIFNYRDAV